MLPSLTEFNRAWLDRRFEQLSEWFHPDVVIRGPGFQEVGRGREACVESYRQFMSSAEVLEFSETNTHTDTWEDAAAVTYDWTMAYRQGGETKRESGHELLVFRLHGGRWVVVLRVILF